MSVQEKVLESATVARFQDCDPFGHMNNARYIEYLLDARQDQVKEHYGLAFFDPERGTSWVVSQFQIAYFRPISTLERVKIKTRLLEFSDSKITIEGTFFSDERSRLKALSWFDMIYIDVKTGRKIFHPREMLQLFEKIKVDDTYSPNAFQERTKDLRGIMKDFA